MPAKREPELRPEATPAPRPTEIGERAPAAPAVPPRTLADIPGLGPIRVRALQKAGIPDLAALRTTTLEQLLAVPGMSAIKAQATLEFLAQHPAPPSEPEARRKKGEVADSRRLRPDSDLPSDLPAAAASTLGRIITLLLSATAFRPRLARELERLAQRVEMLATGELTLPPKEAERAWKRLAEANAALQETWTRPEIGRKEQAQLADQLAALLEKLESRDR